MSFNHAPRYDDEENNYSHPHSSHPYHGEIPMPVCPRCHSVHVETRNRARKLGGAIGAVSGAGSAMIAAGAKARTISGLVGGPAGFAFSGIANAVLVALVSGAASATTGVKLGEVIDEKVLNNYLCLACGHTFSLKRS